MSYKKIVVLCVLILMTSGCSLLPRLTFNSPGTTPQKIEKSQRSIRCAGEILLDEDGRVISCTKKFSSKEKNYEKAERKFTLKEKIINFFRKLTGLGFWGMVVLVIFFPGLIGSLLTFLLSASRRVARETIGAIKRFRRESAPDVKEKLDNYLRDSQSKETKKYISNIRKEE